MKIADGKVATIVSPRQIAINVGANKEVKQGDLVTVYNRIDVSDPVSHEDLGDVLITKVKLRITVVYARFSVAETFEKRTTPTDSLWSAAAALSQPAIVETVTTDPTEANYNTLLIAIGDSVFVERADQPAAKPTATNDESSGKK